MYIQVYLQAGKLFPALLEMLTDQSDRVRPHTHTLHTTVEPL